MNKVAIQFGSKKIEYELRHAKRKSLGITVTPERNVVVKAPHNVSLEKVSHIVRRRAPWILKQQDYFLAFYPKQPPKRFINGETHLYLGRQYRLRVEIGNKEKVRISGGQLIVVCMTKNRARDILKSWYRYQAKLKFSLYSDDITARFKKYDALPTEMIVRSMSKRWGSCTSKGKIVLNAELVKAPRGCIEYVIVHELCHLVHRDHNRKFIELQARMMPEWEIWKNRLEKLLA